MNITFLLCHFYYVTFVVMLPFFAINLGVVSFFIDSSFSVIVTLRFVLLSIDEISLTIFKGLL